MDIEYKIKRVLRWSGRIGLFNAISFEVQQTIRRPVIVFRHGGIGRWIYLRSSSSDISVFEHTFIEKEFDIELDEPKLIIDGGANSGLASVYFATRYPGAEIIAIEPSSANCEMSRRNVKGLNVEVIETALWSRNTTLRIEDNKVQPWSFRCVEANTSEVGAFPARDMASILAGRTCDLLKLDIEGAEVELFRDADWLYRVGAIVVEVHSEEARALIHKACDGWNVSQKGEKLYFVRE